MGQSDIKLVNRSGSLDPLDHLWMYWNNLRDRAPVPARCDVRPAALGPALPHACVIERQIGGVPRFRVVGGLMNDLLGMDVRGMPVTSLFSVGLRARLSSAMDQVFEAPSVLTASVTSTGSYGAPGLSARLMFLPLMDQDNRISRALGGIALDGAIGVTPRRFDQLVTLEGDPLNNGVKTAAGPRVTVERTKKAALSERPYLRLV